MSPPKSAGDVWNAYRTTFQRVVPKSGTGVGDQYPNKQYWELVHNANTGLKYTVKVKGPQPDEGYPLFIGLHGGGGNNSPGDKYWNDHYWADMSDYYQYTIDNYLTSGVYISARGVSDDWKLHFEQETYLLFQGLIRNLLFKSPLEAGTTQLNPKADSFINPNKTYLLGFSAGGDGVYRLATVLSDRFAAANMSGGHPGSAVLRNLANLPIALQVGQWDGDEIPIPLWKEAERNQKTVAVSNSLETLAGDSAYYRHDIFVHPTPFTPLAPWLQAGKDENDKPRSHNSWGNDHLVNEDKPIIKNWKEHQKWRVPGNNDAIIVNANSCAVTWVGKFDRQPYPNFVIWDFSPRLLEPEPLLPLAWGRHRFSYWLAVEQSYKEANSIIRATYNKDNNEVWIEQTPCKVVILLNQDMVNLANDVKVFYGPQQQKIQLNSVRVTTSYEVQKFTMEARGDPKFIFSATIVFDPTTLPFPTARDGGSQIFTAAVPRL